MKRILLIGGILAVVVLAVTGVLSPRLFYEPGRDAAAAAEGGVTGEPAAAGRGVLTVRARLPGASGGRIAFALYDSAESFGGKGDPLHKAFLALENGDSIWRLEDLPYGDYAVKAYHDADGDRSLDRGAFGAPTEPYGFSRNARGKFGPPGYDEAVFRFAAAAMALEIDLR